MNEYGGKEDTISRGQKDTSSRDNKGVILRRVRVDQEKNRKENKIKDTMKMKREK